MYQIIKKRNIWLSFSTILVVASIVCLFLWGLNFGLDFTGGSLLEVKFEQDNQPSVLEIQESLQEIELSSLVIQPTENNTVILRFQESDENTHRAIIAKLRGLGPVPEVSVSGQEATSSIVALGVETDKFQELRFDAVGPSIGQELKSKAFNAIVIVLLIIIFYIALVFQKVSKPVSSWKYGIAAIIALFHDIIITLGIFSVLGEFYNIEINTPFVAAILTVLGYSVNDTIIVFDRTRENLPKSDQDFAGTVNTSVNQTITRSINTSLTTLLVLLSILFFGGATIRDFVLALSIGVFIGTYSSIFVASPLLVVWEKLKRK